MLYYPLQNIYVTSPFGGTRNHNGTDYRASVGTPVLAPADGKVQSIYDTERGGKQLVLLHDNGYKTGYAHLNSYNVNFGERVKQGEQIALTGNTGIGTGPHLHFTVTDPAGNKLDPETVLKNPTLVGFGGTKTKQIFGGIIIVIITMIILVLLYRINNE